MLTRLLNWINSEKESEPSISVDLVIHEPRHVPAAPHINIKDIPESIPSFKKEYEGKLSNNAVINLSVRNAYYGKGRYWSGTLTQPNGTWIVFDPERVADKIIDRELVPLINDFVASAFALDADFIKGDPNAFVDERGQVWKRLG